MNKGPLKSKSYRKELLRLANVAPRQSPHCKEVRWVL